MDAAYVFAVAFRLDPDGATVDPERFETTMEVPASDPGTDGWLFFRDRLWRGEIGDEPSFRTLASDRLGVEVVDVEFRELRTDREYLDALRAAIAEDLGRFNADSVDEVLRKYLGSSVHVREE
ncbi:LWR-salt protein [Halorubrum sp. CBA1229]|uniref:LWR-salt protein n=1 Tax=Halorubrum sp. CBA1229 TaxID=1853699 RepID=UPI000F3BCBF1|nr:LWR-salt protein [Halorubrum sp. CBA1229]QKY17593.1 LWR-salt protein [Halorubrum sp. CBA1229]